MLLLTYLFFDAV